ncbi:MAG TPA: ATP-binding protein, partial [Gemmatimonadales bacterium]|nr:ATP-binding protein [Gemmatimonadales bacterium]
SLATNEAMLRQAQKMEAIGQLAGGVAHDFNNILGAIMMQASLAQGEPGGSAELTEALEEIRHAAERGANLTRQLLLFSRKQVIQPRVLDLNEVVTSLARMLQRMLGEDVRMELILHPGPLCNRADAGMIDQVLMNLAVNARDAMPGGGRLIIETLVEDLTSGDSDLPEVLPGKYASMKVSDTGTGIAPEALPHIFEPFFTTKAVGKGTGLGLATAFGIVQQHRGTMRVTSSPGKGTTFEVLLPLTAPETDQEEAVAAPASRRKVAGQIMVVEDDTVVRNLLRQALEREGYRVLSAAHGPEALRLWQDRRARLDLLLTDIVMPEGISGPELAARLQAQDSTLKVIYTSGYTADLAPRGLRLEEGVNFLQKPVALDHLLETVGRVLDGPARNQRGPTDSAGVPRQPE